MRKKVILAGGSGFLGEAFAGHAAARGWDCVILSRSPRGFRPADGEPGSLRAVEWDGRTAGDWAAELDGADAVVNFTGRSVNCVHTPENKRLILESRVDSVTALGTAIARSANPPRAWIQCSSLALYGDAGDRVCDEEAPRADDFSANVVSQWEAALDAAETPATRKVALRIGLVLGPGGGALGPLVKLVRLMLGGTVGPGDQYMSWLHIDDMNELIMAGIERDDLSGAYNACTAHPVTNAEFMRELRKALKRPWSPPAPEWAVRFGARFVMRTDADLALTGRRCVPARLEKAGFGFKFPELRAALADLSRRGL